MPEKRARPRAPVDQPRSLVLLFTGDGKGKTTAALGVLLRAWGRGLRVVMLSFIKAADGDYGEQRAARKLGIEINAVGRGFTWLSDDIEKDRTVALDGWRLAQEKIASGSYDVVILDELTYPIALGWLSVDTVIDALRNRPENVHVIITGRKAPDRLIAFADLVTEMREVKHPLEQGTGAVIGIDF